MPKISALLNSCYPAIQNNVVFNGFFRLTINSKVPMIALIKFHRVFWNWRQGNTEHSWRCSELKGRAVESSRFIPVVQRKLDRVYVLGTVGDIKPKDWILSSC